MGALRGLAPVEGVAEDQTEGDMTAPQVRAYRPECSVWSEGETSPFFIFDYEYYRMRI
jgi:hypothetical protein